MENLKELLQSDDLCNCDEINNEKCNSCSKLLGFVDSPYGSIPTMHLMEIYVNNFNNLIKSEFKDLNVIQKEQNNAFENLINKKTKEFHSLTKNAFNELQTEIEDYKNNFNNDIDKNLDLIHKKMQQFQNIINQSFIFFKKSILLLNQSMKSNLTLNNAIIQNQIYFSDDVIPKIEDLLKDLMVIKDIIPSQEILITNPMGQKPEVFFSNNLNYLSVSELNQKEDCFQDEIDYLFNKLKIDNFPSNQIIKENE